MQITDAIVHDFGSADFVIDNLFFLQLDGHGNFSIPRALNAAWNDEVAQDHAAENLNADKVAEETGAAAIARAAHLLRKIESFGETSDDFSSGGYAKGYEFWSVADVTAADRHNTHCYNSAQRVACRDLSDRHADVAFELAGVEDFR